MKIIEKGETSIYYVFSLICVVCGASCLAIDATRSIFGVLFVLCLILLASQGVFGSEIGREEMGFNRRKGRGRKRF